MKKAFYCGLGVVLFIGCTHDYDQFDVGNGFETSGTGGATSGTTSSGFGGDFTTTAQGTTTGTTSTTTTTTTTTTTSNTTTTTTASTTTGVGGMGGMGGAGGMMGTGGMGGAGPVCDPDPVAPGVVCPPECSSCQGNICTILCDGQAECANSTIVCPTDFVCHLNCSGQQGCQGAKLTCPALYPCAVNCGEVESCENLDVTAGAGSFTINCLDHFQVCKGTLIACGDAACGGTCDQNVNPKPSFTCGASCDCSPCP